MGKSKCCCHKGIQTITTASTDTTDQKPIKVCAKCKYTLLQFYGSDQLGANTPELILGRGCVGQDKYIAVANSGYGHYRLLFKYEPTHTIVFGPNTASYHLLYTEHGWEILQGDINTFTAGISNLSLTTDTWKPVTGDDPSNPLPKDSSGNTIYSYPYLTISNPIILPLGSNSQVQAGDRLVYTYRDPNDDQRNPQYGVLWYRINSEFVVQKVLLNSPDNFNTNWSCILPTDKVGVVALTVQQDYSILLYTYDSTTDSISQSKVFYKIPYGGYAVNWDGKSIAIVNISDPNANKIEIYDITLKLVNTIDISQYPLTSGFPLGIIYNTCIFYPYQTGNLPNAVDGTLLIDPTTSSIEQFAESEIPPQWIVNSSGNVIYPNTDTPSGPTIPFTSVIGNIPSITGLPSEGVLTNVTASNNTSDVYILVATCLTKGYLYHYNYQQTNSTGQPSLTNMGTIDGKWINVSYDGDFLAQSDGINAKILKIN